MEFHPHVSDRQSFFFFCQDRNRFDSSDGSMKHFPAGDCCCPSRLLALKSTRGRRRRKQEAASSPSADKASCSGGLYRNFTRTRRQFSIHNSSSSSSQLLFSGIFFPPHSKRTFLKTLSAVPQLATRQGSAQQVQPRQQQEAQGSGNPTRPAVTDPNRRGCPSTFHSATSPFQNAFYGLFTRWTLDTRWTQIKDCAYYRLQGKLMYWLGLYIRE